MNAIERKQEILKILKNKEHVDVEELTKLFSVSKVTIRNDLDELGSRGLLVRTHGGAIASERSSFIRIFTETLTEYTKEKELIAKAASALIQDGDSLIIDNGSTTVHLAKFLANRRLTVATGSMLAIRELMNEESVDLIILGGMLRRYSMGTIGPMTRNCLEQFRASWLFMGASAISITDGISSSNLVEAETKQLMIRSAEKICLLADSSKFHAKAFGKVCDWSSIDYFITDKLDDKTRTVLESHGVRVIIPS